MEERNIGVKIVKNFVLFRNEIQKEWITELNIHVENLKEIIKRNMINFKSTTDMYNLNC